MGQGNVTQDFKFDGIYQIAERGHSVAHGSKRPGVNTHSRYSRVKRYAASSNAAVKQEQSAKMKRLRQELVRVTEERDIPKNATAYFARDATLTLM